MTLASGASQAQKNAHYRAVAQAYVDAINNDDLETILALYADDAAVEDPVGGGMTFRGKAQIRAFYDLVTRNKVRIRLSGHVVGSKANVAVMPIVVTPADFEMQVISVIEFNDTGAIQSYRAHWGPGDFPDEIGEPTDRLTA